MQILKPQRHLFDIPAEVAYFNCAYHGPQLNESRRRLVEGVAALSHPWKRAAADFFSDAESIRSLASDLFGGGADAYAVIPSVSYGMSAAARVFESKLTRGDNVLVIADEFPSTVLTWRRVTETAGATLRTVPAPNESSNWTQSIVSYIDGATKVVSISTCHWTNGARIDIAPIAHACRESGCALIVDASQSLGVVPFDVNEIQPDFMIAAGYKWMLCPYGASLMYVAERWRKERPLEEQWQARIGAEDFSRLAEYSDTYMAGARRFDVGEKGCSNVLPGSIAALQQLRTWGVENIAVTLAEINRRIAHCLTELNCEIPQEAQRMPHMFGAKLPAGFRGNLVNELREQNIFISQRGSSLRFSPYVHIDEHDIERLLSALRTLLS